MRCVFVILLMTSACLAEASGLTGSQRAEVLQWLLSADADTRRRAHQALSQLSDSHRSIHRDVLVEARRHHSKAFEGLLKEFYSGLKKDARCFRDWNRHCQEALKFARRDHEKDEDDLERLARMCDRAAAAFARNVTYTQAAEKVWEECDSQAKILLELEMEMALLQGKGEKAFARNVNGVFQRAPYGDRLLAIRGQCRSFAAILQNRGLIEDYNQKRASWPSDGQRAFARVLNERRVRLGLGPLYLQRELCLASERHSVEMQELRYFSHQSPVAKNRTFPLRAARARYPGRVRGENIYMGSHSHEAAFDAWWKSDGHRRIMLEPAPNHLGIGMHKAYWTMNVGQGEPPWNARAK